MKTYRMISALVLLLCSWSAFAATPAITQAQFNAMLQKDTAYTSLVANVVALKILVASDEKLLEKLIPYAKKTWYVLPSCTGGAVQLAGDPDGYDAATLSAGILFRSWFDGSTWYIAPTPPGTPPQSVMAWSSMANGICSTDVDGNHQFLGYDAVQVSVN